MLDEMFQEGTDKALDDRVARPLPALPASSSFSVWRTLKAPFSGVGATANDMAGFASDVLGAFGKTQAGYGSQADLDLLFNPAEAERRRKQGEAARKAIDSGAAFSTEIGTNFRATARDFMPDPATSNIAENTLFGLSRFMTKAVVYSAAGGPLIGAALTGADEGMTEADRLKAEGVDIKTRTKVGTIAGAVAGVSTILPMAGATKLKTAGLVAAVGPGGFIAQQAASKAILEHAGYDQIAEQYDPFDPVGLAVSTLIPAAFGAHGYRARLKAAASPVPVEAVEAARVQQVRDQIADNGLHDPADVVGAEEHVAAVTRASDQMAAGERVNVSDMLSSDRITREPPIKIERLPAENTHQAPPLSEDERAVEARFAAHVDEHGDALAERHLQEKGAVIDPDMIKTLSEDFQANPTKYANAVHEPSSRLAKLIYAKALAAIKPGDRVLFTAGGGGSGKSESLGLHLASGEKPAVIYDSTLSSADSASKRIDQALEAGAKVEILYTNRQVDKAFEFSLTRPRGVPADVLAKAHVGASDTIRALAEKYKGNPNVEIRIMNNLTDSLADIKPGKLDDVPKYVYTDIERGLYENARRKLQSGDISQERFDLTTRSNALRQDLGGTKGSSPSQPENNVRGTGGHRGSGESSGSKGQSLPADEVTPSSTTTDGKGNSSPSIFDTQTSEIARLAPDMMVQLEGMDAPMRLADAMEAVKAEAAKDVEEAPLLQAAADCFLRSI